jgi:hypothetical protein
MLVSEWPKGIDVIGRIARRLTRQLVPGLRSAIEKLAAESADVECYDAAAAGFLKTYRIVAPSHSGRTALERLARRYVRHFRAELIRQHQYIEAAARRALIGPA